MKKADKKAIEILNIQLKKLDSLDSNTYEPWKALTSDYIEKMLGKDSDQYKIISTFSFVRYFDSPLTPQVKAQVPKLKEIVNNCIQCVEHYGIKKKEWKHILITTHPGIYWALFTALCGGFFVLGQLTANKGYDTPSEISKEKNQSEHKIDLPVKKDSVTPITKPDSIK